MLQSGNVRKKRSRAQFTKKKKKKRSDSRTGAKQSCTNFAQEKRLEELTVVMNEQRETERLTEAVGRYSRRKGEKAILKRVCRVLQQLMEQTSRCNGPSQREGRPEVFKKSKTSPIL